MGTRKCRRDYQNEEEEECNGALIQCADLILPWLNSIELASISSTCKTLNRIANTITTRRSSDASRALENIPIPFVNTVDDQPYAYFIYTPTQTLGLDLNTSRLQGWGGSDPNIRLSATGLPAPPTIEDACGCDCERCVSGCPCAAMSSPGLTRECGPRCRCRLGCGNRLTQGGLSIKLKVVKDKRKGWGLHADQHIRCGDYVCEYTGELLTTKEARVRQQVYDELTSGGRFSSALLIVKEYLPSGNACIRVNLDATKIGNIARFINHSCDGGNLSTTLVRSSGALLPRVCFFASRDIESNEELTFSYGDVWLRPKSLHCFCCSSCCFGILPSENT